MRPTSLLATLSVTALSAATLAATAPVVASASTTTNVNVVGYSIVKPVYTALEQAFQNTSAGSNVTFTNSFGASTTQAAKVAAGTLAADLVNLSLASDVDSIAGAPTGLISTNWAKQEAATNGYVTDSVVVLVVRPGNPKHITGWNSLAGKGIKVVTPDPISSGSARWNLLAAYESQIQQGKSAKQAAAYLKSVLANTVAQPTSGSAALSTFLSGTGDVLLAYEADAAYAQSLNDAVQIIDPAQNTLIENPIALTSSGLQNAGAKAFESYLLSVGGQRIFAKYDFRPVNPTAAASVKKSFYQPKALTTVEKLGGWNKVDALLFNSGALVPTLENETGHSGL